MAPYLYIKAANLTFREVQGCERWKYWQTAVNRPQSSWDEKVRSYKWIIDQIKGSQRVLETCGGLGLFARLLGKRKKHTMVDIDPAACHYLSQTLDYGEVVLADAALYLRSQVRDSWDAIILDFSFHTLLSAEEWQVQALYYAMELRPKYIVVTDTAIGKFHLNVKTYNRHFGVDTFPDYVQLYAKTNYRVKGWDRFRTLGGGGAHIVLERIE